MRVVATCIALLVLPVAARVGLPPHDVSHAVRDSLGRYLNTLRPRDAALAQRAAQRMGPDSSAAGIATVKRWVRSAPPLFASPALPESTAVSEHQLLERLDSSDPSERALAIQEVGRQRSRAGLEVIKKRLEDAEPVGILEATAMMEALGVAQDSSAVPQLAKYAAMQDPYIRAYAYHALGQIGDPRALLILRPALFGPCGFSGGVSTMDAAVRAMGNLGEERDVPMLETVAQTCFLSRSRALAAIGAIAGPDSAIAAMSEALGPEPSVKEIFALSDLGEQIQSALAERRAIRRDPSERR